MLIPFSTLQLSTEQCGKLTEQCGKRLAVWKTPVFHTAQGVFHTAKYKMAKFKKNTVFAYFPGMLWKTVDSRLFTGIFLFSRWRNENLKQDLTPLDPFGVSRGKITCFQFSFSNWKIGKLPIIIFHQLFSITVTGK